MFVVYGASIDQLKSICSSLSDCEGFNSEGWVKSKISGKKRAVIDLYVKQVARRPPEADSAVSDSDAGVFAPHLDEYSQMEQNFKMLVMRILAAASWPRGSSTLMFLLVYVWISH